MPCAGSPDRQHPRRNPEVSQAGARKRYTRATSFGAPSRRVFAGQRLFRLWWAMAGLNCRPLPCQAFSDRPWRAAGVRVSTRPVPQRPCVLVEVRRDCQAVSQAPPPLAVARRPSRSPVARRLRRPRPRVTWVMGPGVGGQPSPWVLRHIRAPPEPRSRVHLVVSRASRRGWSEPRNELDDWSSPLVFGGDLFGRSVVAMT